MQKVILYIQPQLRNSTDEQEFVRVDLMEEELITLTQVIQDITDIEKLFTDYSRTFNLPASKTNNKIFKYWYDPDVEGFDNTIFSNARIELDHFEFKIGKIKLEQAVMKHGKVSMYKVTFFGNTLTLTDTIGNEKLENLSWLSNLDFITNESTIKNGLQNGLDRTVDGVTYTNAFIYPLINHSGSYFYNSQADLDNGLNISVDMSTNQLNRGVIAEDLKPAISVKLLIKAIEEQYNYTFASGGFFDSDVIDNMFLWLHRTKGKIEGPTFKTLSDAGTFTCTSNTTNCNHFNSSQPPIGPASSGGVYIFSPTMTAGFPDAFTYEVEIIPTSSTTQYTLEIIDLNTDTVYKTLEDVTGTQSLFIGFGDPQFFSFNNWVPLPSAGLNLTARVKSDTALVFDSEMTCEHYIWDPTLNSNMGNYINPPYRATFTQDANTSTSQVLRIQEQVPDLKVLDLLRSMFKMFNLTAFLDFFGQIHVKTLDSYYLEGNTFDITEYVESTQHDVCSTVPFNEIDLEYEDPKYILAEQFFDTNNRKYGEIEYIGTVEKAQKYEVKVPLEHMLFERLPNQYNEAITTIQVGASINDKLEPELGKPLLFYGIRQLSFNPNTLAQSTGFNYVNGATRNQPTYGALFANGTSRETISNYWIPSVCNELGTVITPPKYCLNFGSEINTYTLTDYGGNNNSLFQVFYNNYITRLFNKRTRVFKYKAILPLKILLQLELNDKLVIGTREFTINKMSTKLNSGETNFELLNEPSNPEVTISYSQESYCTVDSDPTPVVSPTGGTFSAS